jgi:dolichyl-phosphate beta-glucosyltransferase
VYEEAMIIEETMERIVRHVESLEPRFELIVVDNGSRDDTLARALGVAGRDPRLIVLHNTHRHGKGWAVKTGMLRARGRFRVFADADLSTPIEELDSLLEPLRREVDVAIGSRKLRGSEILVSQPLARVVAGQVYNVLVRLLFYPSCRDSQCGFKAFTAEAAEALFPLQRVTGFGFDVELLHLARRRRMKIVQVPVRWSDRRASRVRISHDAPAMLGDLVRVRAGSWLGVYRRPGPTPHPEEPGPGREAGSPASPRDANRGGDAETGPAGRAERSEPT